MHGWGRGKGGGRSHREALLFRDHDAVELDLVLGRRVHAAVEHRDLGRAVGRAGVQGGGQDPPAGDGGAVGVGEAVLPRVAGAAPYALQQCKTCRIEELVSRPVYMCKWREQDLEDEENQPHGKEKDTRTSYDGEKRYPSVVLKRVEAG